MTSHQKGNPPMGHLTTNDRLRSATANDLMLIVAEIEAVSDLSTPIGDMVGRHDGLISLLENTKSATDIGLVAKAAALLAVGPESSEPSHQERLAISLATDILRFFGGRVLPIISTPPGVALTPVSVPADFAMSHGGIAKPQKASFTPNEGDVRC